MDILIIGAKGQLGSEVTELLSNSSYEHIGFNSSELDITNFKKVNKTILKFKPKIIVNASAYTNVDGAESKINKAFKTNSEAVKNLSRTCSIIDSTLIHVSTDYVFDGTLETGYEENHLTSPLNNYGQSKLDGENHLRKNLKCHYILRTSWVFGKNGKNFVKTILNLAKKNNEIKVVNDQYGKPTSAASLAKIILSISEKCIKLNPIAYGTYNFANTPCVSWFEFATKICEEAEKKNLIDSLPKLSAIKTSEINSIAKRPKYSKLKTKKIKEALSIKDIFWEKELQKMLINLE